MTSITCKAHGSTAHTHPDVGSVRRHYTLGVNGETWPCGWQFEVVHDTEDGPWHTIEECDAATWETKRGHECANGHEHVDAQTCAEEGWGYAADAEEAALLVRYGAGYQPMGPATYIDQHEVAHHVSAMA